MPHLLFPPSNRPRRSSTKDYAAVFCLVVIGVTSWSQAATDTWTGATSGTWDTTTSNWLDDGTDTLFNSGNDALFTGTPTNNVTSATGLTIGAITLDNTFTGTVTLTGANTLGGAVTISGGTLSLTNAGGLGASAVTVNSGGTLAINPGVANSTVANNVSGTGLITAQDPAGAAGNTLTLSGTYSGFTGTLNILAGASNNGKVNFSTTTQANVMSSGTIQIQSGATLYLNKALNYGASVELFGAGNAENLGALRLESNANQTGSVTLRANSFIGVNGSAATISGNIGETGGSFGFTKQGNNTLTLTGSNMYSGTTTISSGTLQIGNGGTTGALGLGGVTNNATLTFNRSNDFVVSNNITSPAGTGIVNKQGAGKLTLSGSNTIGNNLTASAGTLEITGTTTIDGGAGNNIGYLTVAGNTSLTVSQGGSLNILGTTGGTKPNSIVGQNAAGTSTITVSGGSFTIGANTGFVLGNNRADATGVLTIDSGIATITRGSTTATDIRSFVSLGRDIANGIINLNGGVLATDRNFVRDGSAGADVSGSANFVFNGGTLRALADQTDWLNSSTKNTNQLALTSVTTGNSGAVSTIDANGFSVAINNNVSGTGGFDINSTTNTGTVTFAGANTYSGNTTVTDGVLLLTNTSGSGTGLGDLSVGASGTIAGTGQIAPNGTAGIAISGALAPGASPSGIGTLTFDLGATTGTGAMLNGAEFRFDLGTANVSLASISAGSSDTLSLAGAAAGDLAFNATNVNFLGTGSEGYYKLFDTSFDGTTWTGLSFDSTTGIVATGLSATNLAPGLFAEFIVGTAANGADSLGDIYVHVVPEPCSSLTLLAGACLLGLGRRRQRP